MNKKLTKWFKNSCKNVGHSNYGEIKQIIEKHEGEEDLQNRKFQTLVNKIND